MENPKHLGSFTGYLSLRERGEDGKRPLISLSKVSGVILFAMPDDDAEEAPGHASQEPVE